jgi:uncharacterized membrane protein
MVQAPSFIVKSGLFFAVIFFSPISGAFADLSLCNRTSFVAETALGIETQDIAATRGWFRINPGQCRIILRGTIEADHLYVHARPVSVYGPVKPLTAAQTELCVGEKDFLVAGAKHCSKMGERFAAFAEVRPREIEGIPTVQLAEPNDYSADQARLAAIQRLLSLAGYDVESIDGIGGPRTDTALAQFLRERKLTSDIASSPSFIDILIDAVREGATRDLLWCNETAHAVMAALGVEQTNTIVTRGWWRVEPGACVRPDVPHRAVQQIYSFAEAVDNNQAAIERKGQPLQWGGRTRLCTRNTKFEIREHVRCESRGLATQGFEALGISAKTGTTVRFRESK